MTGEFSYPLTRWLLKSWFFVSAILFLYLFWIDVFVHRWFVLLWSFFSFGLGFYVAPAIRIGPQGLGVKYLWRYRRIPWARVIGVQRSFLGAQIMTSERNWAYRVVGYQVPMPRIDDLVEAIRARMGRRAA